MSETERAWAAGFFDGEGCVGLHRAGKKYRPQLQVAQSYIEPLLRFQAAVGVGTIYGPYGPYATQSRPYYQFNVTGKRGVAAIFEALAPYLGSVKTADFEEALA